LSRRSSRRGRSTVGRALRHELALLGHVHRYRLGEERLGRFDRLLTLDLGQQLVLGEHSVNINLDAIGDALAHLCPAAELDPRVDRKVDRFGAVEVHVEAGVVASGEGENKLVLVLDENVRSQSVPFESDGRDRERLVTKKLIAAVLVGSEVA
jgi:hypothetical protein